MVWQQRLASGVLQYYGINDINKLQTVWLEWVKRAVPPHQRLLLLRSLRFKTSHGPLAGQSPDGSNETNQRRISATAARQSIYAQRAHALNRKLIETMQSLRLSCDKKQVLQSRSNRYDQARPHDQLQAFHNLLHLGLA